MFRGLWFVLAQALVAKGRILVGPGEAVACCWLRLGGPPGRSGACLRQQGGPQTEKGAGGQGCTAPIPPAPLTSSFTEETVPENALGCELLLCGDDYGLFPLLLIPFCLLCHPLEPRNPARAGAGSGCGWGQSRREEGRGNMREK